MSQNLSEADSSVPSTEAVVADGKHAPVVGRERVVASSLAALSDSFSGIASSNRTQAEGLVGARSLVDALKAWAAHRVAVGEHLTRAQLLARIGQDIAAIDKVMSRQLDIILHAKPLQQLESSWRGLAWLIGQADEANTSSFDDGSGRSNVKVKMLSVKKRELLRDYESAVEFDRSHFWRKVYEEEFGMAGGTPYGLLVADYEFSHHPDDVRLLTGMSETAAASFAPLLVSPSAELVGADRYDQCALIPPIDETQRSPAFTKWRGLREREESRFVGLPLPRVLARHVYDGGLGQSDADWAPESSWKNRDFRYVEQTDGSGGANKLWMSGIWPFAGIVVREYGRSGWFADIRGGSRGVMGGGQVEGLPVEKFSSFEQSESFRGPADAFFSEDVLEEMQNAGLIPLSNTGRDGRAVFHSNASLHRPKVHESGVATSNERISSMLQYVLCVSRFAHYIKVIMRDKTGTFSEAGEVGRMLNDWIHQYVTPDDQASVETRAKLPLRAADIDVAEEPGSAGMYKVIMRMQPHFQIDHIDSTLRLVSTVRQATGKS